MIKLYSVKNQLDYSIKMIKKELNNSRTNKKYILRQLQIIEQVIGRMEIDKDGIVSQVLDKDGLEGVIERYRDIVFYAMNVADYSYLTTKNREPKYAIVRQVFQYIMSEYAIDLFTLEEIAKYCGGRHHATVINSRIRIKGYLDIKDDYITDIIGKIVPILQEQKLIYNNKLKHKKWLQD
jgi:chromosomal replication initiation ATPase DnaA